MQKSTRQSTDEALRPAKVSPTATHATLKADPFLPGLEVTAALADTLITASERP